MNSLQSFNSVANDSWENNPLAPFLKGESMIRQQYQECPVYRGYRGMGDDTTIEGIDDDKRSFYNDR